jgi:hypothetical protein
VLNYCFAHKKRCAGSQLRFSNQLWNNRKENEKRLKEQQSRTKAGQASPLQRTMGDTGQFFSRNHILQLQSTIGNRATAQLLKSQMQQYRQKR